MKKIAVIGLGFGDEGKGMVTSALVDRHSEDKPLVVRYSGGHQAGHTVYANDMNHVFSNFGSGTLQGAPTYWSKSCTVDPVGLRNELKVLVDKMDHQVHGVTLFIDRMCPVTTPYDKQRNQDSKDNIQHGTCGVGFGATIQREEDNYHLHFDDLFNPVSAKLKLKMIATEYYNRKWVDFSEYMDAVRAITSPVYFPHDVIKPVDELPEDFDTCIFEGSQGLLLDKDIGFFPHVTRSNVGMGGLAYRFEPINEVYYVTRAYQTRHGNGPMTHELELGLMQTAHESNKEHKYQGKFRTGYLDLDLLRYGLEKDRKEVGFSDNIKENLVITCMDQVKSFMLIEDGKAHAYKTKDVFVNTIADKLRIQNVYLSWSSNTELIKYG